ncbi:hypothetical protein [Nitrosomonas halophila]|uniref:PrcB C-terminal n=1 Tax=Nitrosomonas halophila TaxID=44576 RepID=A0A1H3J4X9_9PROT|nr:hypothetical protein [Nitrosomonas halophila]SDY34599.1 hypothetical protein SAMN05421881_103016 [Nitrosomonas halophila]
MPTRLLRALIGSLLVLAVVCTTHGSAADIYSHIVLKLPYALRSDAPWIRIIQTQEEWESLYQQMLADNLLILDEVEPAPLIDFQNFQLIAGGLGMRPHIGDRLLIESVHELEDEIIIQVLEVRRTGYCIVLPALSYPSATILIRKTHKPIRISSAIATDDCDSGIEVH